MSVLSPLTGFFASRRARRDEEDIFDFLGVRQIDPEFDVLVLSNHIAAIYEVAGTDYVYSIAAERERILARWANTLTSANVSVQLVVIQRPLSWDLPEGYLTDLAEYLEESSASEWQRDRFERFASEIRRFPFQDLRMYVVLRHLLGDSVIARTANGEEMMAPPPSPWRFWEKPVSRFRGAGGLADWQRIRATAAEALNEQAERFFADLGGLLGLERRLRGRDLANLLSVLWRDEEAYAEWLTSDDEVRSVVAGSEDAIRRDEPEWLAARRAAAEAGESGDPGAFEEGLDLPTELDAFADFADADDADEEPAA